MKLTDEQIAAYADGELSGKEEKIVKLAIEQDDAAAERLKMYLESRELLRKEFGHILSDPVPDHLEAIVKENIKSFDFSKIARLVQSRPLQAIAATLIIAVFIGGTFDLLVRKSRDRVALPPNSALESQMQGLDERSKSFLTPSSDAYAHKVSVLLAKKLQENDDKQEYEILIDGTPIKFTFVSRYNDPAQKDCKIFEDSSTQKNIVMCKNVAGEWYAR